MSPLRFDLITIFPEMFEAITRYGIAARAIERNLAQVNTCYLRDFAHDA